ncbi:uncharacterized protein [Nicotiana sylvestris]|uniref:uncharacterized protein n=1 Tax=Nicotiana sylvestris TaxID=4096 RepID=UPI00388CB400
MGLNVTYTGVRGNTIMMQPSPTIDRAYYLLLQEERQKGIQSIGHYPSDSSSFAATTQKFNQSHGNFNKFGGQFGSSSGANNSQAVNSFGGYGYRNKQEHRKGLLCNYCKKLGQFHNNETEATIGIKQEQLTQLMKLFQQVKIGQQATANSEVNANVVTFCSCFPAVVDFVLLLENPKGPGEHQGIRFLISYVGVNLLGYLSFSIRVSLIVSADSSRGVGGTISDSHKVYSIGIVVAVERYVGVNLLGYLSFSIRVSLIVSADLSVWTVPRHYLTEGLSLRRPLVLGDVKAGLYHLYSTHCFPDSLLWHVRLGHLPISAMSHIHGCTQSNSTQAVFLIIVDDYNRFTWTYLLSTKSNAFTILQSFLSMVERQFDTKVKTIRLSSDYSILMPSHFGHSDSTESSSMSPVSSSSLPSSNFFPNSPILPSPTSPTSPVHSSPTLSSSSSLSSSPLIPDYSLSSPHHHLLLKLLCAGP